MYKYYKLELYQYIYLPVPTFHTRLQTYQERRMAYLNKVQNNPFELSSDMFYVELVITDKPDRLDEEYITRKAMRQTLHQRVELKDIFSYMPASSSTLNRNILLTVGAAGIGKSTVTQKIVHSWSTGDMWADRYDMVFHFRCRELAEVCGDRQYSMAELLLRVHGCDYQYSQEEEQKLLRHIQENQHKTLVIIDGLDEMSSWTKTTQSESFVIVNNLHTQSEVHNIINCLINKKQKLMGDADIIVTTRPIAQMINVAADRYILILGFDESSVSKCLLTVCREQEFHQKIMAHLETHINLMNLCTVPFLCVLFGVVSKKQVDLDQPIDVTNMTQLLIKSLYYMITKRDNQSVSPDGRSITEPYKSNIQKLASLAARGTLGDNLQLIYTKADVHQHGLTDTGIPLTGLLEASTQSSETEPNFSFLHFIYQEFLCAVHVCLTWDTQHVTKLLNVDQNSRSLDNVQLFMAGLFGDTDTGHTFLNALLPGVPCIYRAQQFIKQMSSQRTRDKLTKLQLIRCLHEGRMTDKMEEVTKTVMSESGSELYLYNTPGGLLPHHLASAGWFIQESQCVKELK